MAETLRVTIDRETDGKREGVNEFSVELADTGDAAQTMTGFPSTLR